MKHQTNFFWLDLVRGISAILVLISHVRALLFLEYSNTSHNVIAQIFYFITGFGHISVIIFFVLSGFFIIGSVDKAIKNNQWSFSNYSIDRLVRLWIVLVPSLFLTLICDHFGKLFFPDSLAYNGRLEYLPAINLNNNQSFSTFLGNIFFTQKILVPTFGTNSPLWSLAYEFWYYCLFPLIYLLTINFKKTKHFTIYAIFTIAILMFIGKDIRFNFLIWLMGGIPYIVNNFIKSSKYLNFYTSIIFLLFLLNISMIRINKIEVIFNDYTLGFTVSILIFALTKYEMKFNMLKKITLFLSNISYTLYLIHMPLAVFIISSLSKNRYPFKLINFSFFLCITIFIIIFSYIFWICFEKRTYMIKKMIKKKLFPNNNI